LSDRPARIRLVLTPPDPAGESDAEAVAAAGGAVAVIDVLRATSSLARAWSEGAREAWFFATPEEARAARRRIAGRVLLCGERRGKRIRGFDLGNSPFEYERSRVANTTLLFATTNGSLAFLATKDAAVQWAVAFVNLEAAAARASDWIAARLQVGAPAPAEGAADLLIVCAGKEGEPSEEDAACAGRFALRVMSRLAAADIAVEMAAEGATLAEAPESESEARDRVSASTHGRYLASLGPEYERDVEWCGRWDVLDCVPEGAGGKLSAESKS
jgi:2-phosphosulfolactate phosphatase